MKLSEAGKLFEYSIQDAEKLLARFDSDKHDPSNGSETLKRAGMIIALAAWETYIKDRFREEIDVWIGSLKGSQISNFVLKKVDEDLKRFFNPNHDRTKNLFKTYFDIDITEHWKWDNYLQPQAKKALNELISKRGDAAHKANTNAYSAHIVKRDDLEKAIRFLKGLVNATEKVKIAK
jgi:hypothetical protein